MLKLTLTLVEKKKDVGMGWRLGGLGCLGGLGGPLGTRGSKRSNGSLANHKLHTR